MKKRRFRFTKKVAAILLTLAVALGGIGYRYVSAMIDETNSVHIKASEIEESTLIIGTHLIYLGAMTDSIYDIAVESEQQSSQYRRYYKSELADGTWFDITDATSLADITKEGVPVSASVIEELNMTHHTKSDGITYDLCKNKAVCIFDINNPYDLQNLEELEPVKEQYERLVEIKNPTDTDKRNIQLIQELFTTDYTTALTRSCDRYLAGLQTYYQILVRDEGDPSMTDMVQETMKKVDAARRTEVLGKLQDLTLNEFVSAISKNKAYKAPALAGLPEEETTTKAKNEKKEDETEEEEDGSKVKEFVVDNELSSAAGQALSNVEESYMENSANRMTEGDTILSKAEYDVIKALAEAAIAGNYSECDTQTEYLIYLDNINNSTIGEDDKEVAFIDNRLLPVADSSYKESLSAGACSDYNSLPSTAAAATKNSVLKHQKNDTEAVRAELQFILQAKIDRMSTENGINFIKSRIQESTDFSNGIKNDAYKDYAQESVDAYVEWLNNKLSELSDQLGDSDMDALQDEKEKLQEERLNALDNNDLSAANKLAAQIEAIDKSMADVEKGLNNILKSSTATAAEKADAAAKLGKGSASSAVNDMSKNAKDDIASGNYAGVGDLIDGIGALSSVQPDAALSALQDVYKELTKQKLSETGNNSALDDLMNKVEDVTADNMNHFTDDISKDDMGALIKDYFDKNGNGDGDGNGNGIGNSSGNGNGRRQGSGLCAERPGGILPDEV